jgi:hypothetical protein
MSIAAATQPQTIRAKAFIFAPLKMLEAAHALR